MNEKNNPHKYLDFSRQQLRGDAKDLDPDTREKLLQMRHRALEASLDKKSGLPSWAALPILAFTTAIIFFSLVYLKPYLGSQPDNSLEDLEILISNEPIEFYESLEFLQNWNNSKNDKKVP
jgi:hypothetical protein